MLKTLYLPNFVIKLFLEEKLLAIKVKITTLTPLVIDISKKSMAFIGLTFNLVDGEQLNMLGVKMSRKIC